MDCLLLHTTTVHLQPSSPSIKLIGRNQSVGRPLHHLNQPWCTSNIGSSTFFKDNIALSHLRKGDTKLEAVLSNRVQADDAGKYTWLRSHEIIDWKEDTWVERLFHCLKEQEEQLGIQVVNISQRGQVWQEWHPI